MPVAGVFDKVAAGLAMKPRANMRAL
jgi:hypothetical protein